MIDGLKRKWQFNKGGALESLRTLLELVPEIIRVSSAFFDFRALNYLIDHMAGSFELRLLLGFRDRDKTEDDVKPALEHIQDVIRNGLADEVVPAALALWQGIHRRHIIVREFRAKYKYGLHAKAYYADTKALLVGSPNFSKGGFENNVEIIYPVTDPEAVAYFVQQFDDYFDQAKDITLDIEEILEKHLFQEAMTPYGFYLLCLHHLYPQLRRDKSPSSGRKYHLADYQTHLVIMARSMLVEQRRAMMISPTGTGKTVMGCRVAAELRDLGLINRVFVVAPASLVVKWHEHLRDFGFSPDVHSMQTIQHKNSFFATSLIYKALRSLDGKTLLIVDESQHFKNLKSKGELVKRVEQLLKIQHQMDRPYSLALTATPYSRSFKNFETQLAIIGQEARVRNINDLLSQPIIHITLPFIVQEYAKQDEHGAYLQFGSRRWRFANIQIDPQVIFDYPFDELLTELENLTFLMPRPVQKSPSSLQMALFPEQVADLEDQELDDIEDLEDLLDKIAEFPENGQELDDFIEFQNRMPAFLLLKFALSSHKAFLKNVQTYLGRLDKYKLLNRDEVEQSLLNLKRIASQALHQSDDKVERLLNLCRGFQDKEKVLIFCEARETTDYLVEQLRPIRPGVEKVVGGMKFEDKLDLVSRFAPLANNRVLEANEYEIFTLVATDCISEGLDFQDAHFLVNYDLPWTPLTLVQRLGRLDRPTENYREFKVYNFVPPVKESEMILKIISSLTDRADVYRQMSRINLLRNEQRTAKELLETDPGFIKLFLDGTINYVEYSKIRDQLVPLPVTAQLADLAKLTPPKREELDDLPSRARSAMKAKGKKGYFILFKHAGEPHVLVVDETGKPYPETLFEPIRILLSHVSCTEDEPLQPMPNPKEMNRAVSTALREWADSVGVQPDEITELGTEALV